MVLCLTSPDASCSPAPCPSSVPARSRFTRRSRTRIPGTTRPRRPTTWAGWTCLGTARCPSTASIPTVTRTSPAAGDRPRRERLRPARRSCATSTGGRRAACQRTSAARVGARRARRRRSSSRPGVRFAAWTYNGRVPGPTLRCREGDRLRITFVNGSSHPHTIHFHGIHPAEMDGVPGPRRRADRAGPAHGLRVRRAAGRAPPLPLPRAAAGRAHRQGAVRRVHRRSQGGPRGRRRDGDGHERLRHELRSRQRDLRRQHDRLRVHGQADRGPAQRARAGLRGQRPRVRPHQLVPPSRQPLQLLPDGDLAQAVGVHGHRDVLPGPARDPRVALPVPGKFMFHAHQSEFTELGWQGFFEVKG